METGAYIVESGANPTKSGANINVIGANKVKRRQDDKISNNGALVLSAIFGKASYL